MLCECCGFPIDESNDGFGTQPVKVGRITYCSQSCAASVDSAPPPGVVIVSESPHECGVRWNHTISDHGGTMD